MSLVLTIGIFAAPPDRVTAILGLEPTSIQRKGELLASGRVSRVHGWDLDLSVGPFRNGRDYQVGIKQLMQLLEGRQSAFQQLKEELNPKSFLVYGEVWLPDTPSRGAHGLWLDDREIRMLADCGLGWGVDLNVARRPRP